MAGIKLDSRQVSNKPSLPFIGGGASATVRALFTLIDPQLSKLFEDRNAELANGGLIAFPAAGTSVTFSENLYLHLNSLVAGGSPTIVDLGSATRTLSANGRMVYAVVDRGAGTAVVTDDSSMLPSVVAANQEVFLIAKRVDTSGGIKRVYFRSGFALSQGQTARLGNAGTMYASEFAALDATDTTKRIVFQASGGATGKTLTLASGITDDRTITFPDASDTLVGLSTTDVLLNKTLAFLRTSVATDATTTGSAATLQAFSVGFIRLTNASLVSVSGIPAGLSGQLVAVENKTGAAITVNNEDTGTTAADRILTGTGGTVTMQNNATFLFTYDSTNSRWMLTGGSGSGSGSGGINYIGFGDAEASTTGWILYSDAAQNIPVDATGGTATGLTFTASTSGPLRGNTSYLLSKDAANRQGKGVAYDFDIDSADKASMQSISFDFNASTGFTVADGVTAPLNDGTSSTNAGNSDLEIFIYDVTNAILIPVSPQVITAKGDNNFNFKAEFQTASNSTSYRLVFHIATASATAWDFKFDNVVVGPQSRLLGPPVIDATQFTPTGSWVTNSTYTGYWWRTGETMSMRVKIALAGAPTSAVLDINLPPGFAINTAKLVDTTQSRASIGSSSGSAYDVSAVTSYPLFVQYSSTTAIRVAYITNTGPQNHGNVAQNAPFTFASGDFVDVEVTGIPIVGWSSTTVMSNDTDTRVVAARYSSTASQAITGGAIDILNFGTKEYDTHGAVTTGASWKFTAPVSGNYKVSANYMAGAVAWTLNDISSVILYKNGSQHTFMGRTVANASNTFRLVMGGSTEVFLNAGEFIDVRINPARSVTTDNNDKIIWVAIERLSGPATIAANETVSAKAVNTTTSISGNTTVVFTTERWDTHNAYNTSTGIFTAPISGKYQINTNVTFTMPSGGTVGGAMELKVSQAGSVSLTQTIANFRKQQTGTSFDVYVTGSVAVQLLAGDTVKIQVESNINPSVSALTGGSFDITRTGN